MVEARDPRILVALGVRGRGRRGEAIVQSVALIYQPRLAEARRLAERCAKIVEAEGYQPRLESAWELGPSVDRSDVRLAVALGGDGTIIRAARWLAGTGTPILGVAMGRLGFLTELPPEAVCEKLPAVLAGSYWRDERLMLSARIERAPGAAVVGETGLLTDDRGEGDDPPLIALNDVVVARGASPRVAHIDVRVDGIPLVRYVADGVIVATPTGSTAYALAAGGPVLAPGVEGLVLVPVAPHLAVLRSLVIPVSARIEVRASSEQPPVLVLDGQEQVPLGNDQAVVVEVARERTVFARLGSPTRFYETLVESLKKR